MCKKIFIISIFILLGNSHAFSLSEKDYQYLLNNSPYFKEADKELLDTWKSVTSKLNPDDKKIILSQQRKWINQERDLEAKELIERGFSKDCAYAIVSRRRAGNLKVFDYNQNLSDEDKDAGRIRADDYYYDEDEASKFSNGGQCVASSDGQVKHVDAVPSAKKPAREVDVIGRLSEEQLDGKNYYCITTIHGEKVILEQSNEFNENNIKKACIKFGLSSGNTVTLRGFVYENEKYFSFVDNSYICMTDFTYMKTIDSPKIKGLHLGLSYNEAANVVSTFPLTPDNLSPTPGIELAHGVKSNFNDLRAFSFTDHAVKDLYNVSRIDSNFLRKFMDSYKIKGKEISYEEFAKKFMTDMERDDMAFEFVKPIPGINISKVEERSNTRFIDCGVYCFYFLPSAANGRGYIGFIRQVETPVPDNHTNKKTVFD